MCVICVGLFVCWCVFMCVCVGACVCLCRGMCVLFVCCNAMVNTQLALCVRFPELYGLIVFQRCRRDDVFCGMAGGAEHGVRVSLQLLYYLFALQIPYVDHIVLAATDDPL